MIISSILIASGITAFLVSCIVGLLSGSRMLEHLRATDPALYSKLQVGAGVQLLVSPSSPESQRFVLKQHYKNHPNASVRLLGGKVHMASYFAVISVAVAVVGFVIRAVAR